MEIVPESGVGLQRAVEVIRGGGIVAHATETCYGFACNLTNPEAVRKLFALKRRPFDMPVSALFPSIAAAKEWVEWNELARELAAKHLPGPLTLVLGLRTRDLAPSPTLGIRISSHPFAQRLAELCAVPLSTTSANLHGQPNPYSAQDVVEQFRNQAPQPDLILDSGGLPDARPSTVVSLVNGEIVVVREGGVKIDYDVVR